jgi:hypothetical protein
MGYYWIDQYSILHFATGIIAYFWGISLYTTLILHILFELFENTTYGMIFINKWFPIWPGGKDHPDSLINCISDTLFTFIGWILSYKLDIIYSK